MLLLIPMLFAALAIASLNGCGAAGNRTVFVPESSPMRIGPKARFKVWIRTQASGEWELSSNEVAIPEGWYIVPPSYVSEDNARDNHD
jgi:hypothetical protein